MKTKKSLPIMLASVQQQCWPQKNHLCASQQRCSFTTLTLTAQWGGSAQGCSSRC